MPTTTDKYRKVVPDAYHGTSIANANSILTNGFKYRVDANQYLGSGVYFFESCWESAKEWAQDYRNIKDYAVLKSAVLLDKCLDLNTYRDRRKLEKIAEHVFLRAGKRVKDGDVIDHMIKIMKLDYTSARYTLIKTDKAIPIFRGSRAYTHTQIIICVFDTKEILQTQLSNGA